VGGQLGVKSIHRVDAEVKFYKYQFPTLFLEVFWKQPITLWFILTYDLQINVLRFVTGHAQWSNWRGGRGANRLPLASKT